MGCRTSCVPVSTFMNGNSTGRRPFPQRSRWRLWEELARPNRVFTVEARVGVLLVDVVGIARVVVDSVQDCLQVEAGVGVRGTDRDGDHGQALSQRDRPELGVGAGLGPADQDGIRAIGPVYCRQGRAPAQEIDYVRRSSRCIGAVTDLPGELPPWG